MTSKVGRIIPVCPICETRRCKVVTWTGKRNGKARTEQLVRETCGRPRCVKIKRARSQLASIPGGAS